MVGTTATHFPSSGDLPGTPATIYTYGGATPDADPNGWVYIASYGSGTTTGYDTWRVKKDGTASENLRQLFDASSGATKEGYAPVQIIGSNIFTIDNTSGTTGVVWRISSDGGATWVAEDFAEFPTPKMTAIAYTAANYGGKIYLLTRPTVTTTATEIWSVDPSAWTPTAKAQAVKEFTIPTSTAFYYCNGLAVDATYFYVGCARTTNTNWVLIRIDRTTGATLEIMTTDSLMNFFEGSASYSKSMFAVDRNADGVTDYLYVRNGGYRESYFVCNPTAAQPYYGRHTSWNTALSGSYEAMGYDPVENVLWAWDYSNNHLIKIQ